MSSKVKLPYCSHYISGDQFKLNWLKALTSNDDVAAKHLDWHVHDELEIIFPLRGHYRYEFKKKVISVDNTSFIIIPGGMPHRLEEAIDPPGGRLHFYLKDPAKLHPTRGSFTKPEYEQIYRTLSERSLCPVSASPLLTTLISSLGKFITKSPHPDQPQDRFLCCMALCLCANSETTPPEKSPSQTVAEAVSWLKQNYSTAVHLDELIDHIGYSRARFFALFKQHTNMTPSEYLRNIRIDKAKEMLIQTDFSAKHIGKVCGLGDPAHFSRLFCKLTGYTPLAYRHNKDTPRIKTLSPHGR